MTENLNCRLCMKDTNEYILIFDDEMETEISQLLKLFQLMITPDPYKSNISCMTCYLKLVNFRKFHESCIGSEKLWNKLKRFDIKVEKICAEDLCDAFNDDFVTMEISKEEEEIVESLSTKTDEQTNEEPTNVINVIEEQKLYECDHCGKKFETKDSIRDHMRLHQLTNPRILDGTNSVKMNATGHLSHIQRFFKKVLVDGPDQEGVKIVKWKCKECGMLYKNRVTTYKHARKHESLPRKVYPCAECGRECKNTDSRKLHMRACPSFTTKSALYQATVLQHVMLNIQGKYRREFFGKRLNKLITIMSDDQKNGRKGEIKLRRGENDLLAKKEIPYRSFDTLKKEVWGSD